MQNDYQILYEVLKEKTANLEASWKAILIRLREASLLGKNLNLVTENYPSIEATRASFGRRINPTLLKSEPIRVEVSSSPNPFLSARAENQGDQKEFPLNRPIGKHLHESAWKKVTVPSITKVNERFNTESGSAKMEYAVYFKQGVSVEKQNILKNLASAFHQIVFDEISLDFSSFNEAFGIILTILSIGHELFNLNSFSEIVANEFLLRALPTSSVLNGNFISNSLENPIELILFAAFWVQLAQGRLVQLFPDSLRCFEKNSFLEAIDPSLVQYFHNCFRKEESLSKPFSESSGGISLHSLLPVAYSNQRDSKNFFRDPTSHSNQQKIRDLFLNLIRHFSTNQLDTSHPNFHRSFGSRVSELMIKVNYENFAWLADLYIQEYEQAADIRLDRLEERMSSRRSANSSFSTTFSLDQIFFLFLQYADSFRLTRAIEKKIIAMISVSLEQANNPHKRALWSECIRKLRSIIKLLAFCRYKMSEILCPDDDKLSVEEEDVLILSWTQDAILNRQLLTLIPLLHEYFIFIGPDSIKSRCSNTVKLLLRYYQVKFEAKKNKSTRNISGVRAKFFLRLSLEDIFRETLNTEFYSECLMTLNIINENNYENNEDDEEKRISKSKNKETVVIARAMDEEDLLPSGVSAVYRSISSQVRSIYVQLNSICMNFGLNTTLSGSEPQQGSHRTLEIVSNSNSSMLDSTPRKVRPITQVPADDLKRQKIQKQLRQWFWWRYGSQKDLVDAINTYILEQLLFPQFPMSADRIQSAETCKNMYRDLICKILPELLPNSWKEHPELVEMILGLSLEVAGKSIKHHFL